MNQNDGYAWNEEAHQKAIQDYQDSHNEFDLQRDREE